MKRHNGYPPPLSLSGGLESPIGVHTDSPHAFPVIRSPLVPFFALSWKSRFEGGLYTESPPMRIAEGSVLPCVCVLPLGPLPAERRGGVLTAYEPRRLGRNALARSSAPAGEHCARIPTPDAPWGPRECS